MSKNLLKINLSFFLYSGLATVLVKTLNIPLPVAPVVVANIAVLGVNLAFIFSTNVQKHTLLLILYLVLTFIFHGYPGLFDISTIIFDINAILALNLYSDLVTFEKLEILKFIKKILLFPLIIFYSQLIFFDLLPREFLEIPSFSNDVDVSRYFRSLDQKDIFRPNGLIGVPITYGMVFATSLFVPSAIFKSKALNVLLEIAIMLSIVLTYSRAAVGLMIIYLVAKIKVRRIGRSILALAVIAVIIFGFAEVDFLLSRLSGADDYALASNSAHLVDIYNALYFIGQSPIYGYSSQFIVDQKIITDGYLLIIMLRYGILIVPLVLFTIKQKLTARQLLFVGVLSSLGFINSAYLNRYTMSLTLILLYTIYNIYGTRNSRFWTDTAA